MGCYLRCCAAPDQVAAEAVFRLVAQNADRPELFNKRIARLATDEDETSSKLRRDAETFIMGAGPVCLEGETEVLRNANVDWPGVPLRWHTRLQILAEYAAESVITFYIPFCLGSPLP